eukprot:4568758-Alexandrium_andersonii.AAC.1
MRASRCASRSRMVGASPTNSARACRGAELPALGELRKLSEVLLLLLLDAPPLRLSLRALSEQA